MHNGSPRAIAGALGVERQAGLPKRFYLGLFLLFFSLSPGRLISWDAGVRLTVTRAIWSEGSPLLPTPSIGLVYIKARDAYTTYFGIGQSLAFVPFDMLGAGLTRFAHLPERLQEQVKVMPIVFLYGPLVGVIWFWLLMRMAIGLGLERRLAAVGASLIMLTTIALHYVAQTAQEESLVAALLAAALVKWLDWRASSRMSDLFWAGCLTTAPLLSRVNSVFAVFPVCAYALDSFWETRAQRDIKRTLLVAAAGLAVPVIVYMVFAFWRHGSPLATGYETVERAHTDVIGVRPGIAVALLFGPGKGFFMLSPLLLLAALGFKPLLRQRRLFTLALIVGLGTSALFHSKMRGFPDGSHCWGTRYLAHFITPLSVAVFVGLQRVWAQTSWRRVVYALGCLGLVMQLLSCVLPDEMEYGQVDAKGLPFEVMLGFHDGQLMRRIVNTLELIAGGRPSPDSEAAQKLVADYAPNVWGPVYARKFGKPWLVPVWLALWVASFWLMGMGLRRCVYAEPRSTAVRD